MLEAIHIFVYFKVMFLPDICGSKEECRRNVIYLQEMKYGDDFLCAFTPFQGFSLGVK